MDLFQRVGHLLMHHIGVVALDVVGRVAVAAQQGVQLGVGQPGQQRRVGDLIAVEMQDRQHGAVAARVQELVAVPARGQWPGLGLTVTDDAGDQQLRMIKGGAVSVREAITEFAALVNAAGCLRRGVAGNAAGKGELPHQAPQPLLTRTDVRIQLAVGAFKVGVGHQAGAAVSGSGDVQDAQTSHADQAVQVHIDKVQARCGAPVAQQPGLDVFELQRSV